jgi:hypothetical protein
LNENLQAAASDESQNPLRVIGSMERAASRLQVHTANLLALTWPWNVASKEIHYNGWEQARLQVDELWAAFRRLHTGFSALPPRQQDLVHAMKPFVQALVVRTGLAFQFLEEGHDCLPTAPYSALIREFYDCAIWLRELAGASIENPAAVAGPKGSPTAAAEAIPA